MSSLDMVAYINSTRGPNEAELRHDSFMAKVPTVIDQAPKFIGTAFYLNGTGSQVPRQIYNLPKREAMLMAMSYSYKLQATDLPASGLPIPGCSMRGTAQDGHSDA